MATPVTELPPLPAGFVIDEEEARQPLPELPEGFALDDAEAGGSAPPKAQALPRATAMQRAMAVPSGFNAFIAGTAGLPVDTALNVWDLAKAGAGAVQGAVTGEPPSDAFLPSDRSKYVGSSQYISDRLGDVGISTQVERPDDAVSRYIHAISSAVPGALAGGGGAANMARQAVAGAVGGAATQGAVDMGLPPSMQIAASLGVGAGAGAATRAKPRVPNQVPDTPEVSAQQAGLGNVTTPQQRSLDWAKKSGMQTTPAMRTGSRSGFQMEAALESSPMTSGAFNKIKDANQTRANEIVGEALGLKGAKTLDSEVLGKVLDDVEESFQSVADKNPRWESDNAVTRVQRAKGLVDEVADEFNDDLFTVSGKNLRELTPIADRFEKAAAMGTMTGESLAKWSSSLRKAGEQFQRNGDTVQADALFALREKIDDVMLDGLPEDAAARLNEARSRYRLLKRVVEQPGVINSANGNVSIASLGNALARTDRKGYVYGRKTDDLYELARFGKMFPRIADSGTATRTSLNNVLDMSSRAGGAALSRTYLALGEMGLQGAEKANRAGRGVLKNTIDAMKDY